MKGDVFPKLYGDLDLGLALPIPHSSVWLRGSAGWGPGDDRDEPFANFYFGGFRNNWVDHREEKRYREPDAFPGLEINEVGGTNYARAMAEWNLPPLRFRGAGTPSFYLTWLRPAVFTSVPRHERRRERAPAHDRQRGRPDRPAARAAVTPRAHALGRLRGRLRERPAHPPRRHAVAQDPPLMG